MSKDLIIVESPAKVKTIKKFLGKNYTVAASVGHVRDLPRNAIGVDEDNDFTPAYQIIDGKEDVVKNLRTAASKAETVYLAPDPDREGEAIAWHVAEAIREQNPNIKRIQFNEITARAVKEALEHPKDIDKFLFDSQQARRILDRLVGYKLSPLLWKKVKRGISAGRVQSVALKLVVEREKERRAFTPEEYWLFKAEVEGPEPPPFMVELWKVDGKKPDIGSEEQAIALREALGLPGKAAPADAAPDAPLETKPFVVESITEKKRSRQPLPPYITSTMQQDASRRLGFSAKRTMSVAQRLYEGVEMGHLGTSALITYMRTDSVRIADEARDAARELILEKFGSDYYPPKPRVFKTKGSAQDAHEAIRPVDPALTPDMVEPHLPKEQHRLYRLIWERFMASQMAAAKFHDTVVTVKAEHTQWRAKGERMLFPGFLAVSGKNTGDTPELPKLAQGQQVSVLKLDGEQKFTQPPPRYSEASLVKEMEEKGIGRPSTYAAILSTIQDREYVRMEEKRFAPTELGFIVSDQLSEHFADLMDVGFTAGMENQLDQVAEGKQNWVDLLKDFTKGFYPALTKASDEMVKGGVDTGVACDLCGKPMLIKFSRNGGEFLGCSGYPQCKNIKNFTRDENGEIRIVERVEEITDIPCEKCGKPLMVKTGRMGEFLGCTGYPDCKNIKNFKRNEDGTIEVVEKPPLEVVGTCPECGKDLVLKKSRTGSRFVACSGYPDCTYAEPFKTGVKCPEEGCGGNLVEKSSGRGKIFYSCDNYPKCRYAVWNWPVDGPCPECGHPVLVKKNTKAKGPHIACPQKGCNYTREDEE